MDPSSLNCAIPLWNLTLPWLIQRLEMNCSSGRITHHWNWQTNTIDQKPLCFSLVRRPGNLTLGVLIQSKLVTRFPRILAQQVRFERNPVYSVKQKETQLHVKSLLTLGNKMLDLIYPRILCIGFDWIQATRCCHDCFGWEFPGLWVPFKTGRDLFSGFWGSVHTLFS